ncbi:MAG: autotransporter-associated beta strand repeat protein, partial [Akkermansiaceae bacterium]|nr:autotransporter-associated beta strand repeat protein [Akkermansiaceae bacterium]
MKKTHRFLLVSSFLGSTLGQVQANNGTWTKSATGGLWSGTVNWSAGTIAVGSGFTADFNTLDIAADNTVHLDAPHTLTNLTFGDINSGTAAGWILDNNGNAANILTLDTTLDTAPAITVNGLGTGKKVTISAEVAGVTGLTKAGVGTLVLTGANTYTSDTRVTGGTLKFSGGSLDAAHNLYIGAGAGASGAMVMDGTVETLNFFGGGYPDGVYVGRDSAGTLDVNAGILSNPGGDVTVASKDAGSGGSTGTITVDGGSIEAGRFIIADDQNSTALVVLKSGSISITGPIIFGGGGATAAAAGSLELRGGILSTSSVFRYSGATASTFILNGGTIQAAAANGGFFNGGITYNVQAGGAKFDTAGYDIGVGQVLAHDGAALDGGLTKSGAGTLTLGEKNTINGNVLVSDGVLELTGGAASDANPLGANVAGRIVTVASEATLRTLTTDSIDYFSDIVNNLAFVVRGTWENNPSNATNTGFQRVDNLTLEGAAITDRGQHGAGYGGILMAGAVSVGGLAPSTYDQLDGGSGLSILDTTFNVADVTGNAGADFTINGGIREVPARGTGNLTKSGAGTLAITGVSSYSGATTIDAGTVTVGGAGVLGNGSYGGDITLTASGSILNFASSADQICFGSISGSGSVIHSGTGVLTLSGGNSYTGPTSVTAGTLLVDGSIEDSALTVTAGATVGGIGALGSVVISANGNIAPGDAGTIDHLGAGSATIAGHLKIDHDGSQPLTCDLLEVSGNL